jgi:hypothetical protein
MRARLKKIQKERENIWKWQMYTILLKAFIIKGAEKLKSIITFSTNGQILILKNQY